MAAVQLGIPVRQQRRQHAAQQARRHFHHRDGQPLLARGGSHFQPDETTAHHHHRQALRGTGLQARRLMASASARVRSGSTLGASAPGSGSARGRLPVASTRPL
jgi:hypothetical protein